MRGGAVKERPGGGQGHEIAELITNQTNMYKYRRGSENNGETKLKNIDSPVREAVFFPFFFPRVMKEVFIPRAGMK